MESKVFLHAKIRLVAALEPYKNIVVFSDGRTMGEQTRRAHKYVLLLSNSVIRSFIHLYTSLIDILIIVSFGKFKVDKFKSINLFHNETVIIKLLIFDSL